MVDDGYTHIWDCCCDHGLLGTSLLNKQKAKNIHFVDIVPELIRDIDCKLQQFYPTSVINWQTHCIDVAKIRFDQFQGKHLVIIAGIGGDLMTRMIDKLKQNHANVNIDYLLCPVNRSYALREKLIELEFSLIDEILIEDKQRFYEVILISSITNKYAKISFVGDKIWQAKTPNQIEVTQQYLNKTLSYYLKRQTKDNSRVNKIIAAYQAVKLP